MSIARQVFILILLLGIGIGGWYGYSHVIAPAGGGADGAEASAGRGAPGGGGQRGAGPRATSVEVVVATTGEVTDQLESVGTSRSDASIEIVPNGPGRVSDILFDPGQSVSEGDALVLLDSTTEQAEADEARAALDDARQQLERARQLAANGTAPRARVDELNAAFISARARLSSAEQRLADRTIRAPFDGVVGLREISRGQRVGADTRLTTLDDLSVIEVQFSIPERYFVQVQPGRPVQAQSTAFGDVVFHGAVTSVDTRIDTATRSFRVRAEFPNPDLALVPGLFMTTTLTLETRPDAVILPERSVVAEGRGSFVYAIRDDVAHRTPVSLGRRLVGAVEITDGVAPGDLVVITGLQTIRDGGAVQIVGEPIDATEPVGASAAGARPSSQVF